MMFRIFFVLTFLTIRWGRGEDMKNPFQSRSQRGLWCLNQWNETVNTSQQLGQAFFYANGTFTINFLNEINSTRVEDSID